jgi:hypothetical protein
MQERRKSARLRVLKNVKVIVGNSSVIDCFVSNLTSAGARIMISNTTDLPEKLEMTFRWRSNYSTLPHCVANAE